MSDEMMNSSAPAPFNAGPQSVLPPAPRPRNTGTAILIGAAGLVVLAAIIGIVVYVLMSASSAQVPAAGPVVPGTPGSPSTPATSTATGTVTPIPATDNGDVFTPRNPFEVIAPVKIASANDDNNDNNNSSGDDTSTALTLTDITTANGEDVAVVKLGGASYTVGEGDTVGDTDWQVVQINDANVVFLYGDQRITISLGQGTSSK